MCIFKEHKPFLTNFFTANNNTLENTEPCKIEYNIIILTLSKELAITEKKNSWTHKIQDRIITQAVKELSRKSKN
jgi:hypothetical protein